MLHVLPAHCCTHALFSLGGMCGAIVTSPFDVVKTRLQSDLFRQKHVSVAGVGEGAVVLGSRPGGLLWNFVETGYIIRCAHTSRIWYTEPPSDLISVILRGTRDHELCSEGSARRLSASSLHDPSTSSHTAMASS